MRYMGNFESFGVLEIFDFGKVALSHTVLICRHRDEEFEYFERPMYCQTPAYSTMRSTRVLLINEIRDRSGPKALAQESVPPAPHR